LVSPNLEKNVVAARSFLDGSISRLFQLNPAGECQASTVRAPAAFDLERQKTAEKTCQQRERECQCHLQAHAAAPMWFPVPDEMTLRSEDRIEN
jgi:hypothetical protein